MKANCQHDCGDSWVFPKRPGNRPGLDQINYRIATYADFREHLFRQLNQNPALLAWTYRKADDPGIALLEGAAMLSDVLTFYQNQYANEAFLHTAQWRESIAELVRLLGYRLSPGLGGEGTFAFEISGSKPVTIPLGFPMKAQLEGEDKPAEFESSEEVVAYPGLSTFNIYRPWQDTDITAETREFYIAEGEDLEIETGDRFLFAEEEETISGGRSFGKTEIMVVDSVRKVHGKKVFKLSGAVQQLINRQQVAAFKLGRSFMHFGSSASSKTITLPTNMIDGGTTHTTNFIRQLNQSAFFDVSPALQKKQMLLDEELDDLSPGVQLLCQFPVKSYCQACNTPCPSDWNGPTITALRTITAVHKEPYKWGSLEAIATVAKVDDVLLSKAALPAMMAGEAEEYVWECMELSVATDIRKMHFHEVVGGQVIIRPLPQEDAAASSGDTFMFYGTDEDAQTLLNRQIVVNTAGQGVVESTVTGVSDPVCAFDACVSAHRLVLDEALEYSGFPQVEPESVVYGNLVFATQGKTQKEKILGNGDQRRAFQTFKIPKAPLTYLLNSSATPPEVPEVEIYVDERRWTFVPSLFGYGPDDEIYIIREDEAGDSYVQFGDSKTGSRLPAGIDNVKAVFRTGISATGEIKEDTTVQAGLRLDRLKKIFLPGIIEGGSEAEEGGLAKAAAPGKVQSLGRLVSLKDYETEALGISGVAKVRARWGLPVGSNVPAVVLTVLMESESDTSHSYVEEIMNEYNRDRGPERFAVVVEPGEYKYLTIGLEVGYDTTYRSEDIESEIREALGVFGDEGNGIDGSKGLLSLYQRKFREAEYRTRIQGVVQNMTGVVFVRVISLAEVAVATGESIESVAWETEAENNYSKIACENSQMLSLYTKHLVITFAEAEGTK